MNFKRYHVSRNLFDKTAEYVVGTTTYNYTISGLDPSKYYTCSTNFERISGVNTASLYFNGSRSDNNGVWSDTPKTFKPNSSGEIIVYLRYRDSAGAPEIYNDVMAGTIWVMVNEGSTALPYEPYSSEVWHDIPHYIHNTSTDTITTLPAVLYPNDTIAMVGLKGNMEQSGTPTPTTPIQPQETGERTVNLIPFINQSFSTGNGLTVTCQNGNLYFDGDYTNKEIYSSNALWKNNFAFTLDAGDYTLKSSGVQSLGFDLRNYDTDTKYSANFTLTETTKVYFGAYIYNKVFNNQQMLAQVNSGNTSLPYEPYGIKIPILSNSITTPVYLGEVQSIRRIKKLVLDGTENWILSTGWKKTTTSVFYVPLADIVHTSEDNVIFVYSNAFVAVTRNELYNGDSDMVARTGNEALTIRISDGIATTTANFKAYLAQQYAAGTPVCVWYVLATPETAVVNEPLRKIGNYADEVSDITIPTIAGANTLSVGTTLQPSEVTVNYKGWHPVQSVHEKSKNLFDYHTMADGVMGKYLLPDGTTAASTGVWAITDYIPINGTTFTLKRTSGGNAPAICLYDSNKNYLTGVAYGGNMTVTITASTNATYARFSYLISTANPENLSEVMLNTGSTPLPYEPYWN